MEAAAVHFPPPLLGQPSTGFTPYRLLLGREPRTKLPELDTTAENIVHLTLKQNDSRAKERMKLYVESHNLERKSCIQVHGGKVLVRAEVKHNQLIPTYAPREYV